MSEKTESSWLQFATDVLDRPFGPWWLPRWRWWRWRRCQALARAVWSA